jgi:hypothetical protein
MGISTGSYVYEYYPLNYGHFYRKLCMHSP